MYARERDEIFRAMRRWAPRPAFRRLLRAFFRFARIRADGLIDRLSRSMVA
jgi:hypothetical protein